MNSRVRIIDLVLLVALIVNLGLNILERSDYKKMEYERGKQAGTYLAEWGVLREEVHEIRTVVDSLQQAELPSRAWADTLNDKR